MPLTEKGREIMAAMKKQYGEEKGEEVFWASKNAGRISGVDSTPDPVPTPAALNRVHDLIFKRQAPR